MSAPTAEPAAESTISGAPKRGMASRAVGSLGSGLVQIGLVVVAMFWLMPTAGLFIASLRSSEASAGSGWWTVWSKLRQLSFDNYADRLASDDILEALWNTALITIPATLLVVFISAGAAYAFAWMEFPGRDWLFLIVVALIVVPIQIGLIPNAAIFGAVGIFGTATAAILFHVAFGLPFAIFLLRNFFIGIPRDLLEAARMDGGKEFTIFRKVVLPLGWPAIASLAIFQFLWVWNDLLVAQVFASQAKPITVALREQTRQFGSNLEIIAPGVFLSMVVPLIVFFAFQRYFVQGVLAGSVK